MKLRPKGFLTASRFRWQSRGRVDRARPGSTAGRRALLGRGPVERPVGSLNQAVRRIGAIGSVEAEAVQEGAGWS